MRSVQLPYVHFNGSTFFVTVRRSLFVTAIRYLLRQYVIIHGNGNTVFVTAYVIVISDGNTLFVTAIRYFRRQYAICNGIRYC